MEDKDISDSSLPQIVCTASKMFDLLSESEPDDDAKETVPQLPPIRPPTPPYDAHDDINININYTRTDQKRGSPNRRAADRLSFNELDAPRRKRPRLRLRGPNPALYLRRARRDAIARCIPGIYYPEEYDPDHQPIAESCEEDTSPRAGKIKLIPPEMTDEQDGHSESKVKLKQQNIRVELR